MKMHFPMANASEYPGALYQAFPLPLPRERSSALARVPALPADYRGPPEPLPLPWALRSLDSAEYGVDSLPDGRTRYWIRHALLRDVTPSMLAWWFSHLEGDIDIRGMRVNRYRAWHPADHVHASYARRLPDGSVGPGAIIHLREMLGGNPDFLVDVHSLIEKLDEEGFIHSPRFHGVAGLVRMEYRFQQVAGGTLYENCLILGPRSKLGRWLQPLVERFAFTPLQGKFWLRHNVEEVGAFEHFLPELYRRETARHS